MLTKKIFNLIFVSLIITNIQIFGTKKPSSNNSTETNPDVEKLYNTISVTGDLETFKDIIARNPDFINTRWRNNATTLHIVSQSNFLDIVKFLVEEKNVDINETDKYGFTPITCALLDDQMEVVDYLYKKGAKLNFKKITSDKEMKLSARACNFLNNLENQAKELKIAIKNNNFENFKHIVDSFPNIENLFKIYTDINNSFFPLDPLKDACKYDRLEMIKYFIEEKKFNYKNKYKPEQDEKMNSLLYCCNKLQTFKYLTQNGCKISYDNNNRNSNIRSAAAIGNLDIVKYLIEEMKENPQNAIEPAFENARLDIIKYLENIKATENNKFFTFCFTDIDFSHIYSHLFNNLFCTQKFLQHILTKYKNAQIKIDNKKYTLTEALICNPQYTASILSTNGLLQKNKQILEKYLCESEKDLEKDEALKKETQENVVIKFFVKVIKICKQIQKLHKKTPIFLVDNAHEQSTNEKATNFLNNTQNTLLVLDALSHKMYDDAATRIMEFSDYECFETPKRGKFKN